MRSVWLLTPAVLVAATSGHAATYLTVEQAQGVLFPGKALTSQSISLTAPQRAAIERMSGARVTATKLLAWRVADGGWFLVDQVIGKHEFITYALGIGGDGAIRGVEVLEYRESYGGEIRNEKWRAQFAGKTERAPLKLDQDIKNISGATLSCRHLTDGVRRLLATYEIALKN